MKARGMALISLHPKGCADMYISLRNVPSPSAALRLTDGCNSSHARTRVLTTIYYHYISFYLKKKGNDYVKYERCYYIMTTVCIVEEIKRPLRRIGSLCGLSTF